MNKVCINLFGVLVLSIEGLCATSNASSYDDCGHPLPHPESGVKAPHNTPQLAPNGREETLDAPFGRIFLPEATVSVFLNEGSPIAEEGDNSPAKTQEDKIVTDGGAVLAEAVEPKIEAISDEGTALSTDVGAEDVATVAERRFNKLLLFYWDVRGNNYDLKQLTLDTLKEDYRALEVGQRYSRRFHPYIRFIIAGEEVSSLSMRPSYWDRFPLFAKVRAWAKWWLNPYAWRQPAHYALNSDETNMEWDEDFLTVSLKTPNVKDKKYLLSQFAFFFYVQWGSKYIQPYIVPQTRSLFQTAMNLRFERVEKLAFECAGFKDVRIETRFNMATGNLEYCVVGEK